MVVVVCPGVVPAQERQVMTGPDWSMSVGSNVWLSEGESRWRHHVPDLIPGLGGGSRLRFRDIEAKIIGIDADQVWKRLVVTAAAGWGQVDGGTLVDEDFVDGFEFSRTRSPLDDGSVYFANLNVGARVVEWRDFSQRHGFLDVLVGYQYWREKYEAFGARDELGFIGGDISRDIRVITHTWTWHGPRIGGRAYVPLYQGLGARVNAFILPWLFVEVEDVHHLRTDLRQNPSVKSDASGGFGWQVEAALTYTFWRGLGVEAGYRWWSFEINNDGDATFRPVGASTADLDLKEVSTRRGGPFFGLYYRF
jgi:hypothetical protein